MKDRIRHILSESSVDPKLLTAFYQYMNFLTKDYVWYTDAPGKRFEYTSPNSIWLFHPKTKEWVFHLYYGGEMWCNSDLFFKFQRDVKRYFNMEEPYFEWFLRLWVEDVVNRKVHKLTIISGDGTKEVEDALKNGIQIK